MKMNAFYCKPAGKFVNGQTDLGHKKAKSVFPPNSKKLYRSNDVFADSSDGSQLFAPVNPRADKDDN
jgi:hypothetical protein